MKAIICKCGHEEWKHDDGFIDQECGVIYQEKGCRECDCKEGYEQLIIERLESLETENEELKTKLNTKQGVAK
jgi:hypothetical protein